MSWGGGGFVGLPNRTCRDVYVLGGWGVVGLPNRECRAAYVLGGCRPTKPGIYGCVCPGVLQAYQTGHVECVCPGGGGCRPTKQGM